MLKRSLFLIGFISWLALVACSSGTVDPNANPFAGGVAEEISSSSSSSEASSSNSSIHITPDSSQSSGSSLPQSGDKVTEGVQIVVVRDDSPETELVKVSIV